MIYLIISIPLLLMGRLPASGHTISKLEFNTTNADVYEIKEDSSSNTVAFVNPKTDQQTLREIVYYHLIERPYVGKGGPTKVTPEEGPDFDETVRPFTNGHGFPFLTSEEQEDISSPGDDDDKDDVEPSLGASHDAEKDETSLIGPEDNEEVVYYYDEDIEEISKDANKEIGTTQAPKEFNDIEETKIHSALPNAEDALTATPPIAEGLEEQAKQARKRLFDSVKARYYKNNDTQVIAPTSARRKREINMKHIPEAPRLGPLNYDSFPPYLRKLISTEKPQPRSRNYASVSSEDERMDILKRKMKDMITKTKSEGGEESHPAPRTYGMNLTEDHGYVWNNIYSEPGFYYNVEASESIEVDESPDVHDEQKPVEDDEESKDTEVPKESVEETQGDEMTDGGDDVKPKVIPVEDESDKTESEDTNKGRRNKSHDDDVKDEDTTGDDKEDEEPFEENARKRKPPKEKPDPMTELLENEKFWTWLADWTAVYIEVLTEHIQEVVQEEVTNQMKAYREAHKHKNPAGDTEKLKPDDESSQKDNPTSTERPNDEKITKDTNGNDEKPTPNKPIDSENKEDVPNAKEERKKDEDEPKKEEDRKKPDVDNKIESAKNASNKNDQHEPTKIQAENLYGSSVGSEQVTNIFIFYPNKDTSKIVAEITNNTDSITNIFEPPKIDERVKEPDNEEDSSKDSAATEKNKDKTTEITENIQDKTTEIPKRNERKTTVAPLTTTEIPKVDSGELSTSNSIDTTTSTTKTPENVITEPNPSDKISTAESIIENSHESSDDEEIDKVVADSEANKVADGSIENNHSTLHKSDNDSSPLDKTEIDNSKVDKTEKDNVEKDKNTNNSNENELTTSKTGEEASSTTEAIATEDSKTEDKIESSTEQEK